LLSDFETYCWLLDTRCQLNKLTKKAGEVTSISTESAVLHETFFDGK
jgi:hypothetical protein